MIRRRDISSIAALAAVARPFRALTQKPPIRIGILAAGVPLILLLERRLLRWQR
jgi:hypothetical protein